MTKGCLPFGELQKNMEDFLTFKTKELVQKHLHLLNCKIKKTPALVQQSRVKATTSGWKKWSHFIQLLYHFFHPSSMKG